VNPFHEGKHAIILASRREYARQHNLVDIRYAAAHSLFMTETAHDDAKVPGADEREAVEILVYLMTRKAAGASQTAVMLSLGLTYYMWALQQDASGAMNVDEALQKEAAMLLSRAKAAKR
jgi:hypothetical protein